MKRWLLVCAGIALASLALAADPPKVEEPAKKADPPKKPEVIPESEQGEGVSLTIYNQNFVVVKERRLMDLVKGRGTVRFKDVAATIIPESVQFSALKQPDAARVVEQNYAFDLVSADILLHKYIDRDIALVTRDGETLKGQLLSFDEGQLILKTANGIDLIPRHGNVKDVQFSALPGGLLTRPTLVWQLDAKNTGKELVKVAYQAQQMSWRVDYRARVNEKGDKLDLAGWVTVMNNTGATFKDAQVKLLAGDVNLVQQGVIPVGTDLSDPTAGGGGRRAGFTEKSFSEYHLYELGRKTTVKASENKQIELMDITGIPVDRRYSLRPHENKVSVVLEFKNTEKVNDGLGIPLPKGPIRVFQRDNDGELEFAGIDHLDHTPKNELITIRLGYSFDLAGERRQLGHRINGLITEYDQEIRLRNHKTEAVKVDVVELINGRTEWAMLKNSHEFTRRDVNTLVFPVEVKANQEVIITYTIRYGP